MEQDHRTLSPGKRRFYTLPGDEKIENDRKLNAEKENSKLGFDKTKLLKYVESNVIGRDATFSGPFGLRTVVYCDYIASGKALKCTEDFICNHVLPMYGNTHTTTSVTSLQSTLYRHEARDIIRSAVRASEHDAVIFTGNGVTGAVHKLISALDLKKPPVVFCGPFEHHSNLLPWREVALHVINISETCEGTVNLNHLRTAMQVWKDVGIPMIGCFSAASNITGQLTDTVTVSKVLHEYGALAFWDYATAAPYIEIEMHPLVSEGDASKDAIFFSPHKFIGGVESPGILVAAKCLFANRVPTNCGGGSVFFVTGEDHRYLKDEETREEGGTPNIIGSIRAGLAVKLKQDIGTKTIMEREDSFYNQAIEAWMDVENLELLGHSDFMSESKNYDRKLAVFSFLIRHPASGLYLHYNYIATILNDLFGIQVRGGCSCAGPYAQSLLGIDFETAKSIEKVLLEDPRLDRIHLRRRSEYSSHEILRPGFVRLNLPYFFDDEMVDFIIRAVTMTAKFAWLLLPSYVFNPETGEWRHNRHQVFKDRKWLGHISFSSEGMQFKEPAQSVVKGPLPSTYEDCLSKAQDIFNKANKPTEIFLPDHPIIFDEAVKKLRWFLTPSEAQKWISKFHNKNVSNLIKVIPPFEVRKSTRELTDEEITERIAIPYDVQKKIASLVHQNSNNSIANDKKCLLESKAEHESIEISKTANPDVSDGSNKMSPSEKESIVTNGIHSSDSNVKSLAKFFSPPKRLFKLMMQAVDNFQMINDGDRVLVCLSGGKDSLSLLHTLRQYQFYTKKQGITFELGAVTVDPKTASYDPSPLIEYLSALGLPYFYETQAILDQALSLPELTSICAFCSRMKRGRLYACARRESWNVLAMGQHLDDLAESFLMSAFQNGLLRTMKANYTVREGDLRVIRPFVYVREKDTREFAESCKLPIIPENCPACFEAPKERHRMKQLLASQEIIHPKLFYSLKEALLPLMAINKTGLESGEISLRTLLDDD